MMKINKKYQIVFFLNLNNLFLNFVIFLNKMTMIFYKKIIKYIITINKTYIIKF
jgi:hypothetical protein